MLLSVASLSRASASSSLRTLMLSRCGLACCRPRASRTRTALIPSIFVPSGTRVSSSSQSVIHQQFHVNT